jgi:uncharacterized protein YpmS
VKKRRNKAKKILIIVLSALITIVILLAAFSVITYFSLVHQPADYQPQLLSEQELEEAEMRGYKKVEQLYNHVNLLSPFTISFSQQMVNELLMIIEQRELIHRFAPKTQIFVHQPQISFKDNQIRIMGLVEYKNRKVVLTICLKPEISADGQLCLRLLPIQAGAVPLPDTLVQDYLKQIVAMVNAMWFESKAGGKIGDKGGSNDLLTATVDKLMIALQDLVGTKEAVMESTFRIDDDILARITGIEIADGQITLQIQPEPIKGK